MLAVHIIESIGFWGFFAIVTGVLIYLHYAGPVADESEPDYWGGEEWHHFDTWAEERGER